MRKKTNKQKVWNNYKRKLYGKSRKRDSNHNSSGISYPKYNNNESEQNWFKPINMGM